MPRAKRAVRADQPVAETICAAVLTRKRTAKIFKLNQKFRAIFGDPPKLNVSATDEDVETKKSRSGNTSKNTVNEKKRKTGKSLAVDVDVKEKSSSSEESEWEEVEPIVNAQDLPSTSGRSSNCIEITLSAPKNKREIDAETVLRREINRFQRQQQEEIQKAHLLCYIAHGRYLSSLANNLLVRACSLSVIPSGFLDAAQSTFNISVLEKFAKWFKSAFILDTSTQCENSAELNELKLQDCIERRVASSCCELGTIFVSFLRALDYDVRLLFSCSPRSYEKKNPQICTNTSEKLQQRQCASNNNNNTTNRRKTKSGMGNTHVDIGKSKIDKQLSGDKKKQEFYWAEVYEESEERWIYGGVRDLTSRYCSGFLTSQIRRLRIDSAWCRGTLFKFRSKNHRRRDRVEDYQLHSSLHEHPLPTSITEYKNHPLYVLKRNLLKFEAIYPEDTKPVRFVRNEAVYPRSAVHTLHSKENWIKEIGEEPYKTVKARPKMGIPKSEQPERLLPIFGYWQTEAYIPPPVVDGVIPRNEYGNVELFQPSMIPPGTVHLHVPGLLSVAKRLGIDCAPAMVGWEFYGKGSHPVLDGWIVCEEHKDALLAAWDHSQALEEQKQKEKRQEKAMKNWKRLTKGLLLRQAMRRKFEPKTSKCKVVDGEETLEEDNEESSQELSTATSESAVSSSAWPQCKHQFSLSE